jgi:hypothetical protein
MYVRAGNKARASGGRTDDAPLLPQEESVLTVVPVGLLLRANIGTPGHAAELHAWDSLLAARTYGGTMEAVTSRPIHTSQSVPIHTWLNVVSTHTV